VNLQLLQILGGKTEHYPYELERTYPRILETILQLWDEDKMDDYFLQLMISDRSERSGFPEKIATEIMYLSRVHAARQPAEKPRDIWKVSSDSFVSFTPHTKLDAGLISSERQNQPDSVLFAAIESGKLTEVTSFLDAHSNTEIRNSRGWTPLMMAAFNGHDEIVNLLIRHHAAVNAIDPEGNSALHRASFNGYIRCEQLLIAQHATVNAGNCFGWTPLILSAARNHPRSVALLINQGALPDQTTQDGYTALHKAAEAGYSDVVKILLEHGADKTLITQHGDTAQKLAKNNPEILELLTQQG